MARRPGGYAIALLIAAHLACCGVLLLAAAGMVTFGGVTDWLFHAGGALWIAFAALLVFGFCFLSLCGRRKRAGRPGPGSHIEADAYAPRQSDERALSDRRNR